VNRVFFPDGRFFDRGGNTRVRFAMPLWNTGLVSGFDLKNTRFVERVPIDKPISVDGFRDQVIGLEGATIGIQVPTAAANRPGSRDRSDHERRAGTVSRR
jgi:hypothetical protein